MPIDVTHILFVSRSLPFHRLGGMEIIAWDLAKQFVKDGYRVTYLTTAIVGKPECFLAEGVQVIALNSTSSGEYSRSWWKKSRDYFDEYLKSEVNLIFSVSAGGYGLMRSKKKLTIPFIFQAHGTAIGEIRSKWKTLSPLSMIASLRNIYGFLRDCYYYPRCDAVIAVGGAVIQEMKTFPLSYFLHSKPCHFIPNGIDETIFKPDRITRDRIRQQLGLKPHHRVMITASRLHAQKGVANALSAFAEYVKRNHDAFFLILGEGNERANLEKLAHEKNIHHHVIFVGAVSRHELANYLAASDLFLFTTLRMEAMPLNVLEALATGLPVVLSHHLKEMFEIKEVLYYVDPAQPRVIAEVIDVALNKEKKEKISCLPASFTLNACAKAYYDVFDVLLRS